MYRWTEHGDNFVRNRIDTRRPLLLDNISNGRAPRASNWLLRLPSHILAEIVAYVAVGKQGPEALSSLALANSDCLQLSRSHRFTEIRVNTSSRSIQIFEQFDREAAAAARDHMDNDNPDLGERPLKVGHCVRRLTFGPEFRRRQFPAPSNDFFIGGVHRLAMIAGASIDSPVVVAALVEEYVRVRRAEAEDEERMSMVLRSLPAMPNLSVVVWENGHHVDRTFFEHISRSAAKHVQLNEMFIKEPALLIESRLPAAWPLITLDIQLLGTEVLDDNPVPIGPPHLQFASLHFQTLFQLCAPTLESLTWRFGRWPDPNEVIELQPIHFPRLAHLNMTDVVPAVPTLSHLLTSPVLRRLALPAEGWTMELASSLEPHQLLQLQSLSVPGIPEDPEVVKVMRGFLAWHTHVKTLRIGEAAPSIKTDQNSFAGLFLPLLGQFHSLTRLVMAWNVGTPSQAQHGAVLSETVLEHIGSLTGLRYLSLGVSSLYLHRPEWRVDHDAIRRHLSKLSLLRVLALHQDAYIPPGWPEECDIRQFYTVQLTGALEIQDANARPWIANNSPYHGLVGRYADDLAWERAHRNRMLAQGETYAHVLPSLKWVFCGQRWMALQRRLNEVQAHPISRERIPDQTVGLAMVYLENAGLVSDRE